MPGTLRIGLWALVHGNRAALRDPEEPYDASWDRNRGLVLEAEGSATTACWSPSTR